MFPPVAYLQWARRFHGTVRFDLATSGVPVAMLPDGTLADGLAGQPETCRGEMLRYAIARYNDVPSVEAIAALGTTHALWLAYSSLTSPGDEILVEEPAYEPLVTIAEGMGVHVRRFARPVTERFALDPERVGRAISSKTRAVVITNLHNPGGVRAPDDDLRAAAQVADACGSVLVVDEVYGPFDEFVDDRGIFGASARKLAPNVVAVSSLTKCYGLGPDRIGWLLGPQEVIQRAEAAIVATAGVLPTSHAHLGLRAFDNIAALADRARSVVGQKRELVARWAHLHGFTWSKPTEGLFGFVSVPGEGDLTGTIERAARVHEVLVTPGAFFGIPNGFRVAWSAEVHDLEEGLARLAPCLHDGR
jgi:aspartate/methionine/tyrosine aminotransferase